MFLGLMLAFVGETLVGLVTDRVSNKMADSALKAVRGRLSEGRLELPASRDLDLAHRRSARFAFHYLIAQVLPSVEEKPSEEWARLSRTILARPPGTAGYGRHEADSVVGWCRGLEKLIRDDAWIDGWGADALDAEALESVATARVDSDLLTAFHASVERELAASPLPEIPEVMVRAVRHGWQVVDPKTRAISTVTLYGAYCLKFQELVAQDETLAHQVEVNSRSLLADRLDRLGDTIASIDPQAIALAVRAQVGPASDLLFGHLVEIQDAVDGVSHQLDQLTTLVSQVDETTRRTEIVLAELRTNASESIDILRSVHTWVQAPSRSDEQGAKDVESLLADYAIHVKETTSRLVGGGGGIADHLPITDLGIGSMPIVRRGGGPDPQTITSASHLAGAESVVLTGGPGTGKSSILRWLAHREVDERTGIAVLVTCRTLPKIFFEAEPPDLIAALVEHVVASWSDLAERELTALRMRLASGIRDGTALLAVDGLDEIADGTKRVEFAGGLARALTKDMRMVITTRDAGAEGAITALVSRLDKLAGTGAGAPSRLFEIAPLDSAAQLGLIDAWTASGSEGGRAYARLRTAIEVGAEPARLASTVFILSLLLQEVGADERLPVRRRDLFRRIVERAVGRLRPTDPPLTVDEAFPRLEHIALAMIRRGWVQVPEIELIGMLREFESAELEDFPSVVARRPPLEFLDAALSSGLLVDAGQGLRRRGIPQRTIAFSHQSFQEYFAGRSLIHRWVDGGAVLSDVQSIIDEADAAGELSPRWIETLRHAIEALHEDQLDARWFGVVPTVEVEEVMALFASPARGVPRPLSVLTVGLWGLAVASEMTLTIETAVRVLARAVDALGSTRRPAAWDAALGDLLRSPWRNAVLVHYAHAGSRAAREWGVGILPHVLPPDLVRDDMRSLMSECVERARGAGPGIEGNLALMELIALAFGANGALTGLERVDGVLQPFGVVGLAANEKAELWDALIELEARGADPRLIAWSLLWLSDARNAVGDVGGLGARHRTWVMDTLTGLAHDPAADPWVIADFTLLAALPWDGTSHYAERDWVYEWALVADGDKPYQEMPSSTGETQEPLASFLTGLVPSAPPWTARWIAIAAARAGSRDPVLFDTLAETLLDGQEWWKIRDEAWFSLLGIGDDRVGDLLIDAIPAVEDSSLQGFGLLGTVALGRLDHLERFAQPGSHYDDCYVFALVGHPDPRGAEIATAIAASHPDLEHRARVADAIERTPTWDGV